MGVIQKIGQKGTLQGLPSDGKGFKNFSFKGRDRQANQIPSRNHYDIHGRLDTILYVTKNFPDFSLGSVPDHSIPDFLRGDDSESFPVQLVWEKKDGTKGINFPSLASVHHPLELRPLGEMFTFSKRKVGHGGQTVKRLRPLRLRLVRILRPPTVELRLRNPCVRFLFRFLG